MRRAPLGQAVAQSIAGDRGTALLTYHYYGWRIKVFSIVPNVTNIKRAAPDEEPPIPWEVAYWRGWKGQELTFKSEAPSAWLTFGARPRSWRTGRLGETGKQFNRHGGAHGIFAMRDQRLCTSHSVQSCTRLKRYHEGSGN
jgi:sigma54-dependent transcription regulator